MNHANMTEAEWELVIHRIIRSYEHKIIDMLNGHQT